MRISYVYIMASRSRVLYVGVTNDLARRVEEHKQGLGGFTTKYRVTRLVYYEEFLDIRLAISREKTLKGWKRSRKISLIEERNPTWTELAGNFSPSFSFSQGHHRPSS
jgi:putative endonuclease